MIPLMGLHLRGFLSSREQRGQYILTAVAVGMAAGSGMVASPRVEEASSIALPPGTTHEPGPRETRPQTLSIPCENGCRDSEIVSAAGLCSSQAGGSRLEVPDCAG